MSIWTKPIAEITYDDIDAFCQAQIPEGVKLDYKRELPNNDKIADLIAAYANTFGGLIVYGVDADQKTNKPILPIEGFAATKGVSERLEAICLDSVYPPVRPEVHVVEKADDPSKMFAVVRVSPSPHAPHATRDHTRICVREGSQKRSDDLTKPATLERIEAILDRRRRLDDERETELELMKSRARQVIAGSDAPQQEYLWFSLSPIFSSTGTLTLQECLRIHADKLLFDFYPRDLRPAPHGTFLIGEKASIELTTTEGRSITERVHSKFPCFCSGMTARGQVFVASILLSRKPSFALEQWFHLLEGLFIAGTEVSRVADACTSQWWQLSMGAENIRGRVFTYRGVVGKQCIDQSVGVDAMTTIEHIRELVSTGSARHAPRPDNIPALGSFLHFLGIDSSRL
jgi:hypothetical protein